MLTLYPLQQEIGLLKRRASNFAETRSVQGTSKAIDNPETGALTNNSSISSASERAEYITQVELLSCRQLSIGTPRSL